jgi:hypothetical protein
MRGTRKARMVPARSSAAILRPIWLSLAGHMVSLVASVSGAALATLTTSVIGNAYKYFRHGTRTVRRPGGHRARHGRRYNITQSAPPDLYKSTTPVHHVVPTSSSPVSGLDPRRQ